MWLNFIQVCIDMPMHEIFCKGAWSFQENNQQKNVEILEQPPTAIASWKSLPVFETQTVGIDKLNTKYVVNWNQLGNMWGNFANKESEWGSISVACNS